MRNVAFTKDAFHEYNQWFTSDLKLVARIQELIRGILTGILLKE
jgi:Txe/YoeB family toxin of Txe-Axe toxin-antitoxin module